MLSDTDSQAGLSLPSDHGTVAGREKRWVAMTSVVAAILLTGVKLFVGLMTGSLGVLAEAAHSALDLVAAVITYFAVRFSDRPADAEHLYGHGKVENLSALAETLLLLVTCGWIIYEAVERLFFRYVPIDASHWAFIVIVLSIVVDISRSRALRRVGRKYKSQALEADALHFSTDVWSSGVVLLGLLLVRVGDRLGGDTQLILEKADAVAALFVALIVVWVSFTLGRRTVDALLDRAPAGVSAAVEKAVKMVDGVLECRQLRLRESGNRAFVDLVIGVRRGLSLESSHAIGAAVEAQIKALLPKADVVVHIDPVCGEGETLTERIRAIAANQGQTVHNIVITEQNGRIEVELHIETDGTRDLRRAHDEAHQLEASVSAELPSIAKITTHIEPAHARQEPMRDVTEASAGLIRKVRNMARETRGIVECHDVTVRKSGRDLFLTMHCTFAAGQSIQDVHAASSALEERVRREIPNVARVTTHPEPLGAD
ncbi:MAG TPA: cation-efflux pump [Phycisphaerae bacterium]|nr:cation-efflux pump [Phycisphaerae bacterium]